jgi:NAD dependent epimerase/dehydratase family enzyme
MSQVVLASQRVIPQAALRAGFQFRFTEVAEALRQIFTA